MSEAEAREAGVEVDAVVKNLRATFRGWLRDPGNQDLVNTIYAFPTFLWRCWRGTRGLWSRAHPGARSRLDTGVRRLTDPSFVRSPQTVMTIFPLAWPSPTYATAWEASLNG
jgi:hypothetical protein